MFGWDEGNGRQFDMIGFRMNDKLLRFVLPLPARDDDEFKYTPVERWEREEKAQQKLWEKACRQRWRALALVVKAKLAAVEAKITTFEEEFLPHIVLPDGSTVSDYMLPQVEQAYAIGKMPPLLPMLETCDKEE